MSKNKYALVTGASSGIGWHISKELSAHNYSIIAVSNQPEKLNELKSELEGKYQNHVITIEYDLSRPDGPDYVFDFCKNKNLDIEVLVNNAGFLIVNEVISTDVKRIREILQLHLNTPVILCRKFGELMAKNEGGHILNVSSIASSMPYPIISVYGPTKSFLRQFSKAFRTEMKLYKVNVSCLMPGATATSLYDAEDFNIPLGLKLGIIERPQVVAKAGVNALFKRKGECIPGLLNKFIMFIVPVIPNVIIGIIYKQFYRNQNDH